MSNEKERKSSCQDSNNRPPDSEPSTLTVRPLGIPFRKTLVFSRDKHRQEVYTNAVSLGVIVTF